MSEVLVELLTEEIPARFLNDAVKSLKEIAEDKLKESRLDFKEIKTYGTPRRLVLHIKDIPKTIPPEIIEIKGPPKNVAIKNGEKTESYSGFLKTQEAKDEDIYFKEVGGKEYLFYKKVLEEKNVKDILKGLIPEIFLKIPFKKTMRWEETGIIFVRPVRSILALIDDEPIKFKIGNLESSSFTYGLRLKEKRQIFIESAEDYFKKLKENYVILDFNTRKEIIKKQIGEIEKLLRGTVDIKEDLIDEVANLVEYPTVFYGNLPENALKIPEVITKTVLEKHQRLFVIYGKDKKILPFFIGVRNGTKDFLETVKIGNENVVRARLEDAIFFLEEDKKHSLFSLSKKLSSLVFYDKLGTVLEKKNRLIKLSGVSDMIFKINEEEQKLLERAAAISKSDLLTNIVREYPMLQGEIGKIYAERDGEEKYVATAIFEQYLPRYAADLTPKTKVGLILSLIDKADTLVGAFAIGMSVSGSEDPYGLRRQGFGLVKNIIESEYQVKLTELINKAIENYKEAIKKSYKNEDTLKKLLVFLKQRYLQYFKENKIPDELYKVFENISFDELCTLKKRLKTIQEERKTEEFLNFASAIKRVNNILKNEKIEGEIKENLLNEIEKTLYDNVVDFEITGNEALENHDYKLFFKEFYKIIPLINSFFDRVLVLDPVKEIRENRLLILNKLRSIILKFGNINELVI